MFKNFLLIKIILTFSKNQHTYKLTQLKKKQFACKNICELVVNKIRKMLIKRGKLVIMV